MRRVQRRVLAGALPNRPHGLRPRDQVLPLVLRHPTEAVNPCFLSRDSFERASDLLLGVIEFEPEAVFRARLSQSDHPCVRPGPIPRTLEVPGAFIPDGIGAGLHHLANESRCSDRQSVEQLPLAMEQEGQLRVVRGVLSSSRIGRRVAFLNGDLHLFRGRVKVSALALYT